MDDRKRENIMNNLEDLITYTNYKRLIVACEQNGLLTEKMCNIIECIDSSAKAKLNNDDLQREKHRRLLIKLTKRGPDAYDKLKNICIKLGFDEATKCLNEACVGARPFYETPPRQSLVNMIENTDGQSVSVDSTVALQEFTNEIKPSKEYKVKSSTMLYCNEYNGMKVYPMLTKHNRGVLFAVNIIEFQNNENCRNGASEDKKSLLHLYRQLNFRLYYFENLTKDDFSKILTKLLKSDVVKNTECFHMVLMTHGSSDSRNNEFVEFNDNKLLTVSNIIDMFYNKNCPNLIGKPKVLIFPFCRGDIEDTGLVVQNPSANAPIETDSMRKSQPYNISKISDLLICYAALTGYKTFRDRIDGSWYIQKFCKIFANNAHNLDVENMIKLTNAEVEKMRTEHNKMQLPNYHNCGFNKVLFYNPGQYASDN